MRLQEQITSPEARVAAEVGLGALFAGTVHRLHHWRHAATHDSLTGVLNKHGLDRALGKMTTPQAVIFVDGTNQKAINDKLGHDEGDKTIQGTAEVVKSSVRKHDIVARIGGDEFMVILQTKKQRRLARMMRRLLLRGNQQERRHNDVDPQAILSATKDRMEDRTEAFRAENPQYAEHGFSVAVGGTVLDPDMTVPEIRQASKEAEADMYSHKGTQHLTLGTHRPAPDPA